MKVEFLHHYHQRHGYSLRDRLIAELPRYAPRIAWLGGLLNLRDRIPGLAALSERLIGFSARRPLPVWHAKPFRETGAIGAARAGEVVLLADTFNRWQEPDNLRAAVRVLTAGGYQVHVATPETGHQPLCCGRTYLAVGDIDKSRAQAARTFSAVAPYLDRGLSVIGLEPSCLLTLRDEFHSLLPGQEAQKLAAHALLFEEFIEREHQAGRLQLDLDAMSGQRALVHGHCHQKAFGVVSSIETTLRLIPELTVATISSTCCGMAGAFGYQAEHYATSMAIGELGVLSAARSAGENTQLVADGTSCRHQIRDGAGREAVHAAVLLARQLRSSAR